MATLSPPIVRVLYRSLLRASCYGRHPEVFPYLNNKEISEIKQGGWTPPPPSSSPSPNNKTTTTNDDNDENHHLHLLEKLPSTQSEVLKLLRLAFEKEDNYEERSNNKIDESKKKIDPFEVLRHANEQASILLPAKTHSTLPSTIPIFDYTSSALLPGEETQFNFFEPRYKYMSNDINKDKYDSYFILRAGNPPRGGAILVKIVEKIIQPISGNVAVRCRGGPRINIVSSDSSPMIQNDTSTTNNENNDSNNAEPLALATNYELLYDNLDVDDDEDKALFQQKRKDVLELLIRVYGGGGRNDESGNKEEEDLKRRKKEDDFHNVLQNVVGYPPIDPELFSFWILRFILSPNDIASRLRWLYRCQSPMRRINYSLEFLQMHDDRLHRKSLEDK